MILDFGNFFKYIFKTRDARLDPFGINCRPIDSTLLIHLWLDSFHHQTMPDLQKKLLQIVVRTQNRTTYPLQNIVHCFFYRIHNIRIRFIFRRIVKNVPQCRP